MMNYFDGYAKACDTWLDEHDEIFRSEVDAIKRFFDKTRSNIEIGVRTGRFAEKLGVKNGVALIDDMIDLAKKRGVENIIKSDACNLNLPNESYDQALMIFLDCFVSDFEKAVSEAFRILKSPGALIVGFLNKATPLGKIYDENKACDAGYSCSTYHTHNDVLEILKRCKFEIEDFCSCVKNLNNVYCEIENDFGEGIFTVIKAGKC